MPDLSRIVVGTSVNVIGRMRATKYTAADGNDKYFYEVLASKVRMITDENTTR